MDLQEYDAIIRHRAAAIKHQRMINDDLPASILEQQVSNEQLKTFNRQQVESNTDVKTTLAHIETLLARMLPTSEHGREA